MTSVIHQLQYYFKLWIDENWTSDQELRLIACAVIQIKESTMVD